jgi:hypothetical protein
VGAVSCTAGGALTKTEMRLEVTRRPESSVAIAVSA